jgi:hypothetical protein
MRVSMNLKTSMDMIMERREKLLALSYKLLAGGINKEEIKK